MGRVPNQVQLKEWIAQMREISTRCCDADEVDVPELLCEVEHAIRACPRALCTWFGPTDLQSQSAKLLTAGGHVSFALGLCSEHMSYLLSRSAAGHSMVTVALPELERESSFASTDLSLAICGALLNLIAEGIEGQQQNKSMRKRPLN